MTREQILDTAKTIINGERQRDYGDAGDNFQVIADMWNAYLKVSHAGTPLNRHDVANMMILLKVARNVSGEIKDDNYIDIAGYAALGGEFND